MDHLTDRYAALILAAATCHGAFLLVRSGGIQWCRTPAAALAHGGHAATSGSAEHDGGGTPAALQSRTALSLRTVAFIAYPPDDGTALSRTDAIVTAAAVDSDTAARRVFLGFSTGVVLVVNAVTGGVHCRFLDPFSGRPRTVASLSFLHHGRALLATGMPRQKGRRAVAAPDAPAPTEASISESSQGDVVALPLRPSRAGEDAAIGRSAGDYRQVGDCAFFVAPKPPVNSTDPRPVFVGQQTAIYVPALDAEQAETAGGQPSRLARNLNSSGARGHYAIPLSVFDGAFVGQTGNLAYATLHIHVVPSKPEALLAAAEAAHVDDGDDDGVMAAAPELVNILPVHHESSRDKPTGGGWKRILERRRRAKAGSSREQLAIFVDSDGATLAKVHVGAAPSALQFSGGSDEPGSPLAGSPSNVLQSFKSLRYFKSMRNVCDPSSAESFTVPKSTSMAKAPPAAGRSRSPQDGTLDKPGAAGANASSSIAATVKSLAMLVRVFAGDRSASANIARDASGMPQTVPPELLARFSVPPAILGRRHRKSSIDDGDAATVEEAAPPRLVAQSITCAAVTSFPWMFTADGGTDSQRSQTLLALGTDRGELILCDVGAAIDGTASRIPTRPRYPHSSNAHAGDDDGDGDGAAPEFRHLAKLKVTPPPARTQQHGGASGSTESIRSIVCTVDPVRHELHVAVTLVSGSMVAVDGRAVVIAALAADAPTPAGAGATTPPGRAAMTFIRPGASTPTPASPGPSVSIAEPSRDEQQTSLTTGHGGGAVTPPKSRSTSAAPSKRNSLASVQLPSSPSNTGRGGSRRPSALVNAPPLSSSSSSSGESEIMAGSPGPPRFGEGRRSTGQFLESSANSDSYGPPGAGRRDSAGTSVTEAGINRGQQARGPGFGAGRGTVAPSLALDRRHNIPEVGIDDRRWVVEQIAAMCPGQVAIGSGGELEPVAQGPSRVTASGVSIYYSHDHLAEWELAEDSNATAAGGGNTKVTFSGGSPGYVRTAPVNPLLDVIVARRPSNAPSEPERDESHGTVDVRAPAEKVLPLTRSARQALQGAEAAMAARERAIKSRSVLSGAEAASPLVDPTVPRYMQIAPIRVKPSGVAERAFEQRMRERARTPSIRPSPALQVREALASSTPTVHHQRSRLGASSPMGGGGGSTRDAVAASPLLRKLTSMYGPQR